MRKIVLHIIILLTLLSCNNSNPEKVSEKQESLQSMKIDSILKYRTDGSKEFQVQTQNGLKTGNGYFFDKNENIIGFRHYENDTLNGYGLYLNENTFKPKYLVENNKGKRDGVVIQFYEDGVIKSFRSSDIYNDSQKIEFHNNGTIKSIGKTKTGGQAQGTWLYFNEKGKLDKTVEYENGNVKK
ncbi:hypothetical protein ML462_15495 [Gramella lutea]|uniref:Toxin-antitoxin system YwqK family antitoxin n=1 Tax=Christiangramia lutea TaxID=1607951 RepID=A0A9X2ACL2_9FLAO|nr:hypothetical protein [Christiangramia lutea]MCH4824577.1 hypothetical protein [Christiangramia lutea]